MAQTPEQKAAAEKAAAEQTAAKAAQKKAAAEKAAAEQKVKKEAEALKKSKEKKLVNKSDYDKYTGLKFLELSETKLSDETKKELKELEAELLTCEGRKSIRTVRAAIDNEQALLVEGIPVPVEIKKLIESKGKKTAAYYFG